MGFGYVEMACPNGHVWVSTWCSVGGFRGPLTTCPTCKAEGSSKQKTSAQVMVEHFKPVEPPAEEKQ